MLFNGQTFRLSLDTDADISLFTGTILYTKPNGVTGSWAGIVSNDVVYYDVQTGDVDVTGVWRVQAKAVNGSNVKYGKIQVIEFRSHI